MFFFYEPEIEQLPPQEMAIPSDTVTTDEGLYLVSEEGLYIIFD